MSAQKSHVILLYDSDDGNVHLATDVWGELLKFGPRQEAVAYLNNVVLKTYPDQKFIIVDVPVSAW